MYTIDLDDQTEQMLGRLAAKEGKTLDVWIQESLRILANRAETVQYRQAKADKGTDDFFALAGLWSGRNIDEQSLRKDAWPKP